jgi:hypothetical protein
MTLCGQALATIPQAIGVDHPNVLFLTVVTTYYLASHLGGSGKHYILIMINGSRMTPRNKAPRDIHRTSHRNKLAFPF